MLTNSIYKDITNASGDALYCYSYLKKYWPEIPEDTIYWESNRFLLDQYYKTSQMVSKELGSISCVDISTGPVLAPIISLLPFLEDLQLSDFSPTARLMLAEQDCFYWWSYIAYVIKLEGGEPSTENILRRLVLLKYFKSLHPILTSDLTKPNLFEGFASADFKKFNFWSCNFVPEAITAIEESFFEYLHQIIKNMKSGDFLSLSVLIETPSWGDGVEIYKSPKLKVSNINGVLEESGFSLYTFAEHLSGLEEKDPRKEGVAVILARLK